MTDAIFRITLSPLLALDEAWSILEDAHIKILWGSEEEGKSELFINLNSSQTIACYDWIVFCEPYSLAPIDWQSQWAAHGINYQEGRLYLDPATYGKKGTILQLEPGCGFGNLSHPTTRIMLHLLAKYLHHRTVIDIGCGSGILSLFAAAIGATVVFGIDIDPGAIEHSIQNAQLNHLEKQCSFYIPSAFNWRVTDKPVLILMNMIHTEQDLAWDSLPVLHHQPGELLTSGIRMEERDAYLKHMTMRGWSLLDEMEEEDWLGFYFCKKQ